MVGWKPGNTCAPGEPPNEPVGVRADLTGPDVEAFAAIFGAERQAGLGGEAKREIAA